MYLIVSNVSERKGLFPLYLRKPGKLLEFYSLENLLKKVFILAFKLNEKIGKKRIVSLT
jgi:hypothetical protein